MAVNSRKKGKKGEKVAAEVLAKWTKKKFASTPSSGGLQWRTSLAKGDVVCTTEGHYFPFCVEVKNHKEINFAHLLTPLRKTRDKSGVAKILEFWSQASRDAKAANKIPMLLMRYDNLPRDFFFVVVTQEFAKLIHTEISLGYPGMKTLRYHDYKTNTALMIFSSHEFFASTYKPIKLKAKTYLKSKL
jgi:hypothetical protein